MSDVLMPENTPVWVNEKRCKACDICVSRCPAGVLAMQLDAHKVLGKILLSLLPIESNLNLQKQIRLHKREQRK